MLVKDEKAGRAPPKSAVIVYKKSKLELYVHEKKNQRYTALLEAGAEVVAAMEAAHESHQRTLAAVKRGLEEASIRARTIYRARLRPEATRGALVITVGGDGTLLDASRKVQDATVLGVNSDPDRSVGFLCAATAESFQGVLARVCAGEVPPTDVARLRLRLDGEPVGQPVLNDVLVADRNPAAMVRYLIEARGAREEHRSSGVWIAAPAGTTAAIHAAGGWVLALDDPRMEARVRECFPLDGPGLKLGEVLLGPSETLKLTSKMREGRLFLDGPHQRVPFPVGSTLEISPDAPPLRLYVTEEMRERRREVAARTETYHRPPC